MNSAESSVGSSRSNCGGAFTFAEAFHVERAIGRFRGAPYPRGLRCTRALRIAMAFEIFDR